MPVYLPLADEPAQAGMMVTAEQAEGRTHGKQIQRFGGFVSLAGAMLLMSVRVKDKSEKSRKKAKMIKLITVAGGLGVFALSQMESR